MREEEAGEMFGNCVGYLDSCEIVLPRKPAMHWWAYSSGKGKCGFNLQGVCDGNWTVHLRAHG